MRIDNVWCRFCGARMSDYETSRYYAAVEITVTAARGYKRTFFAHKRCWAKVVSDSVGGGNENQSAAPLSENPEIVALRSRLREAEEALREIELAGGYAPDYVPSAGWVDCLIIARSYFAKHPAAEQEKETK